MSEISIRSPSWFPAKRLSHQDVLGITIILLLALLAPLVDSAGWDFAATFRRETLNQTYGIRTWNPYPTYWLFYPFAVLPERLGFLLWNLVAASALIYAIWRGSGRFLSFACSLPCFWILYIGQMEGFIVLGFVLSLFGRNPFLVGLGLTLLSFKPQVGLLPALFVILTRRNWRILIVPAAIYLLSFLHWGWWIPDWLSSIANSNVGNYPTNVSLFPYSLVLLPLLWFFRSSLKIWLLVESLIMPYFAVYSLALLFTQIIPIWANVLLWTLYVAAIFRSYAVPGFLVPVTILLVVLAEQWQGQKSGVKIVA